jgi:Pyruvate/2-oxoacid:ferredoxin oxidoreductase gamma subunit
VFRSTLAEPRSIVLAGSAGARIGSAARAAGRAAISSGLWAAMRGDYPVTVRTGHSVATLAVSPDPVEAAVALPPNVVAVLAPEGHAKVRGLLSSLQADATVLALPELEVETAARVLRLDPSRSAERISKTEVALAAMSAVAARLGLFPHEALLAAVADEPGAAAAVGAGPGLVVAD